MNPSNSRPEKMGFLDSMAFDRLLWCVPFFFMLHNMEEAPFMESWSKRLPLKVHPIVSTKQFVIAVTFLTLGGFILTFLGVEIWPQRIGYLLVLGIQMVLAFNAFVPHIRDNSFPPLQPRGCFRFIDNTSLFVLFIPPRVD